jgi:hypothetical protein
MLQFRLERSLQKFASINASIFNHFNMERLVSLHVVYEAPMGALGIGSVATGAQGPHGLA